MSPGFCLKVFTELFSLYDLFSSDALRLSDLFILQSIFEVQPSQ